MVLRGKLIFLCGAVTFASQGIAQTDPFELTPKDLLITEGPFKGKSVEPHRRPIQVLTLKQQTELGLPARGPNVLWVANFYDQGKFSPDKSDFHIAAIPLDKISKAGFEVIDRSKFNPSDDTAGLVSKIMEVGPHKHFQVFAEFDSDIDLFSQKIDSKTGRLLNLQPVEKRRWLSYSIGAERPEDFIPSEAMAGAYKKVQLFVGEHEAHREMSFGQTIDSYEIDLPPKKVGDFLKLAAEHSTNVRLSESYHGMTDGCLSTSLRYLDRILFGRELAQFPLAWSSSNEAATGELESRGIKVTPRAKIVPPNSERRLARTRASKDKGQFGPTNPHPFTQIASLVGNCASAINRASAEAQLLFKAK